MPWTMPPMPDQLKALMMRRQSPVGPVAGQPPVSYGPQPTPQTVAQNGQEEGGLPASAVPSRIAPGAGAYVPYSRGVPPAESGAVPAGPPAGQALAQAPPIPPPTDDSTVASLDTSKTPDVMSYLNPQLARMNDAFSRYQAAQQKYAIDPEKVKPRLWERLLGVALGATQLRNPENAGAVADSVVHRRLYGAERARSQALQPIEQEIGMYREGLPAYTLAGQALHNQAELGISRHREERETTAFENETGDRLFQETGPDGQTHYYQLTKSGRKLEVPAPRQIVEDQRKREEDANTPAPGAKPQRRFNPDTKQMEWQIRTKSGAMIPYQFTSVEAAVLSGDPEARKLWNQEHPGREPKEDRRGTPGQFAGAEMKKKAAVDKAHAAFVKATSELVPTDGKESTRRAFQEAHDDYEQATQDAQNAFEQELVSLGGTVQHSDTSQWRGSSRASAAPAQEPAEKVNELGDRKVGDIGVVRGQRVRITAIYKNGKFDYEPLTGAR